MPKHDPEMVKRARVYLKGRPGAKQFSTFNPGTRTFTEWWGGRLAGRNVTCGDTSEGIPHHETREAAVEDARAFLAHCREVVAEAEAEAEAEVKARAKVKPPSTITPTQELHMPMDDRLTIRADEAARMVGIGRTTMFALLKDKAIPSFRVGRIRLIRPADLRVWVDAQANASLSKECP